MGAIEMVVGLKSQTFNSLFMQSGAETVNVRHIYIRFEW